MDPCLFNVNIGRELRLRRHIREVLLPYVHTHITLDHVAFTEMAVEELLLQALEYVPMADATSFLLPTEPFEILMRSLHSLDFTQLEEKWVTLSEHFEYLRTIYPPSPDPQDLPTKKCWLEDDHYMKLSLICRPISTPVLSKRSRRETPNFGVTQSRASIPRTKSALTTFLNLNPVSVRAVDDSPPPPVDDVLDLRIKLDSATSALVRSFLQSVSIPSRKEKSINSSANTPHVPELLYHDSPSRCPPELDTPPLFPRVTKGQSTYRGTWSGAKNDVSNPIRVSDLVSMLKVAPPELIDSEDGNINDHHMEVVNGWTALRLSSPPPSSQHSSDGSEDDELWDISPPGTPATSLMAAKMDEVEIPRIRKFGHKNMLVNGSTSDNGAAALLTVANSPGFFITSFISAPIPMPQTQKPITYQLEGVESGMHSPRPLSPGQNTSSSLLGQPPSAREKQANGETSTDPADCVEDLEGQQLDDVVASIYASTSQDPLLYIIQEKLDDKDIVLMDVPNLPPPTTHLRDPTLFPQGMQSFVAPKGEFACLDTANHEINAVGPTSFLRLVKGIKPLALDLSWRPFNFGKTIPTDEEVAGIAKPIQSDVELLGYHDEKYEKAVSIILDLGTSLTSAEDTQSTLIQTRGCGEFGTSPVPKRVEESRQVEYLLTQRERMGASSTHLIPEVEVEVHGHADREQGIVPWSYDGDILVQLENLSHDEEHQGSRGIFDPTERHSRNRAGHGYSFDDPGVGIMENNLDQFSTSEFGVPLLLSHPLGDTLLHDVDTPAANKENVDDQSENKENVPPGDVDGYCMAKYQPDPLSTQYDWSGYFVFPESETFEPLSFASQSRLPGPLGDLTNSKAQDVLPLTPNARRAKRPEGHLVSTSECEPTYSGAIKRRKLDDLVPASSKDLFSTFIGLRNQIKSRDQVLEHAETQNDTSTLHDAPGAPEQVLPRCTPDNVFDQHTVHLPEPWVPAAAIHRYLASITLIQKRALVRELQGHHCRVDLVERYDLGGADIIVDPDSSVLFIPLLALPAHLESTVERISRESWRYLYLLVVFEAFPSAQSYRADCSRDNRPTPYAYTPPICKAIKKLRRNLGIAEGCGTMNPRCTIAWAFANDVEEAAKFVRCFGEEACTMSNERGYGVLWDERGWLEEEEREGESDLARVQGMNAFAAFIMLYDRSLDTILDLSPEVRLADFGQMLGEARMAVLNAVIERRRQQTAPDIADSVVDPGC